jgi:predicted RNA-binding protein YlxR (DUF448 family)
MESKPKKELIRIVGYDGGVCVDSTGKANGRGIYLCADEQCFAKAKKRRAIGRGLKVDLAETQTDRLFEEFSILKSERQGRCSDEHENI